jgi:phenylacetate-CoA ligase
VINRDQLLRRLAVAGRRWSSAEVRRGQAWTRSGWRLSHAELERRSLARLAGLVARFRRQGLCAGPAFGEIATFTSLADLDVLPVLTRTGVIELYQRLKPLYAKRHDVSMRGTGGWTGEPVHYFSSRGVDAASYGMRLEMQALMGWRPGMACYSLWANPQELGLNQRRQGRLAQAMRMVRKFGRYSPTEEDLLSFLEAIRQDPGCALYGSPGLLVECAHFMRDRGIKFASGHVAAAWSTAETMDPRLPELFPSHFGVPLRDFYGSRETSNISAECAHGSRHINSRYIIETCDERSDRLLPTGVVGSILITDLFNDVTPLIRYQLGDLGAVEWRECECGRNSFVFTQLIGRPPQIIELASGHRLTPYCFLSLAQSFPRLHRVQLVRRGLAEFEFRYAGEPLSPDEQHQLMSLASALAEGAEIRLVQVPDVSKSPSGKPRYYIDAREPAPAIAAAQIDSSAS